jgi:hypothetical protein
MADTHVFPLVECYPVADTYADGLGRIETTGQNLRLVFFTARQKDDGTIDREIVERVILPAEAMIPALTMLLMQPVLGMKLMAAVTAATARQPGDFLQ